MKGIQVKSLLIVCGLACLVGFYIVHNYLWAMNDAVPPYNDSARHFANYHLFLRFLEGSLTSEQISFYFRSYCYAPFYYCAAVIGSLVFGNTFFIGVTVNIIFFTILLISVYAIGKKLFGAWEGLAACALLSLYPFMYASTRTFGIEIAVCSLVMLCGCLLLYSRELSSGRFTIAAAFVCCLGLLTKQTFLFYVLGPVVFTVYKALRSKVRMKRVLVFLGIGVGLPLIFLGVFLSRGTMYLFMANILEASDRGFTSWNSVLYYLQILPDQINWGNVGLFVMAIIGSLFLKMKGRGFILIWLAVPLFIITCAPLKDTKYSLPVLPVIALASSWVIGRIRWPVVRYSFLSGILIFGLFVHYLLFNGSSFSFVLFGEKKKIHIALKPYLEYVHKPRNIDGELRRAQDAIIEDLKGRVSPGRTYQIGVMDYWVAFIKSDPSFSPGNRVFTDNYIVINEWGIFKRIVQDRLPLMLGTLMSTTDRERSIYDFLLMGVPLSDFNPYWDQFYDLKDTITLKDKSKIFFYVRNSNYLGDA